MAILVQGEETSLGPVLSDVITEALFFRNRRVPSAHYMGHVERPSLKPTQILGGNGQ